ncbi:MAG TPA: hypothetical protein VGD51_11375 [Nocardioidaceae bacterium]
MRLILRTLPTLVVLLTAACGQISDVGTAPPEPGVENPAAAATAPEVGHGAWTRLPESPLSPREGTATAYVGGEVVFVGGYVGQPCPPNADCARPGDAVARDGAAYDLVAGTWRRIADAPRPVPGMAPTAVVGEHLYVLADETLLVWDSVVDSWDEVPPPGAVRWSGLVADGTRLVMASSSDENGVLPDRVLDTDTGEWSSLPEDPLGPSFDRMVTPTPEGLVLTAKPIQPDGSPADPALVHAALLPAEGRAWRTLPASDQLGGWRWSWTGRRLVDPTLGGADGGETNGFGRVIPYGGRLDPATGAWSPLPDAPTEGTGGWPVEAPGGPLVAAEGWLYDDADGAWTRLPRPEDSPATPGSAVWAGDVLVVHGGADWDLPAEAEWTPGNVWSTGVWAYRAD